MTVHHRVHVTSVSHLGEGVGRLPDDAGERAGMAVFVPGALPGEDVDVELVEVRRRHARGRLVRVVAPSPDRVEPPCPVAATCGGCDLQHVAVASQPALKRRVVVDQLERLGRLVDPPVEPCRPVGPSLGYRRQARVHRGPDGGVGFHARGSHDVVPITACPVLEPRLSDALAAAAAAGAAEVGLRADDADVALVLTPGPGPLELPDGPDHLLATQPQASPVALRGDGALRTTVPTVDGPLVLQHDATTFFQPSPAAAGAIADAVLEVLGDVDGALAWDLYAGVGLLALAMAGRGAAVTAVEGDEAATAWAQRNANALGLTLDVVTADVRAWLRDGGEAPDVVVLDPPRTGAGEAVTDALARLRPADVVLVSCDTGAAARDLRALTASGFRLLRAIPLDTFPMTRHVELVAHLRA